jgi:hypothetical protein
MTDEVESYWEGIRPPRDPEPPKPSHNSCEDHLKPVGLIYAELSDKQGAFDVKGNPCTVFKARWFELHRWFWWLFIVGGRLSSYEWTVANTRNGFVKASKRVRLGCDD